MIASRSGEASADIAARVTATRKIQLQRNQGCLNARLDGDRLHELARPDAAGRALLETAAHKKGLSARGFNRILRVARTLADLDGAAQPGKSHVASAFLWRGMPVIGTG